MTTRKNNNSIRNKTLKSKIRLNCHPDNKKNKIVRGSCLPLEVLEILKESYNSNYPENMIYATKPRLIWKGLKERLYNCSNEECWLNVIEDEEIKEKLRLFMDRPMEPYSWKMNPYTWLSNNDIDNVLEKYSESYKKFYAVDTSAIDFKHPNSCDKVEELCSKDNKIKNINLSIKNHQKNGKTKLGMVFNLAKWDEDGTHWVALYVDLDDKFIYYFDSTGRNPPEEIKILINHIKSQCLNLTEPIVLKEYNNRIIHQRKNTECGMYCLFFLITMLSSKINNIGIESLEEKIDLFKKERLSDDYIHKFRKIYFKE
tara:strand:- start:5242 stop:6183 length:942 start_codon:yes stop_codon:yes gene_type:complete